ncbi:hypothetical protein [Lysinibacillus xylanilyticus]|uniref:hypothetical protein n=1 Tax=Lysinibacillus xylanilyticus TaxID=582475 RepID=UPI00380E9037
MKKYVLYGSIVVFAAFVLPLFWLKLMQWAFLDDTAIIAEGISFTGAIIGGIISGALTLIGVRYTIQENRADDLSLRLPKLLAELNELTDVIHEHYVKVGIAFENIKDQRVDFRSTFSLTSMFVARTETNSIKKMMDELCNEQISSSKANFDYEVYLILDLFINDFKSKTDIVNLMLDHNELRANEKLKHAEEYALHMKDELFKLRQKVNECRRKYEKKYIGLKKHL